MLHDVNIPHRFCKSGECIHYDCIHLRHGRWQDWNQLVEESSCLYAIQCRIYIRKSRYEEGDRAATFQNFWTYNHLKKNEKNVLYIFLFIYLRFMLSIISFQLLFIRDV